LFHLLGPLLRSLPLAVRPKRRHKADWQKRKTRRKKFQQQVHLRCHGKGSTTQENSQLYAVSDSVVEKAKRGSEQQNAHNDWV